jgi:2,3-dihydroxybenzoate decarboxylase
MAGGFEPFDAVEATAMSKKINDRIAEAIQDSPQRFAGFAAIAPQDPQTAARELERAVKDLGLRGVKINSHIRGEYLDNPKFGVILETAERLGVPIYLHPRQPAPDKLIPYYDYPELAGSMWGYGAETGLHAMRLIVSGVFDKYPSLKIILGHLGEAIPHWLWRIDNRWSKEQATIKASGRKLNKSPGQYFMENFYVSTSGMFWQPALLCAYMALGADRILFAVDYPYESNKDAVAAMDAMPICESDKEKIYHLNAEKLLSL